MDALPWITLRENNVTFHEPTKVSSDVVSSDSRPSYIVFVGKMTKTVLLDELLGGSRHTGSLPVHKDVHLRSSPNLRTDRSPLVIIDSGLQSWRPPLPCTSTPVARETSWPLLTDKNKFTTLMCASVFSIFSSVMCYFVQDLGGLAATAARLAEQITMAVPSITQSRPRILLVLPASSIATDENSAAQKVIQLIVRFLKQTGQRSNSVTAQSQIRSHFAGLEVVALQSDRTNAAQSQALRCRLLAMSEASMKERESAHTNFSFHHFLDLSKKLLGLVCSNSGKNQPEALNLVHASRPCGFSTELLEHCLVDFLEQIPSQAWLWHLVATLVASALMLASYPPGAHGKHQVFEAA
jgi:hypothetical protein